MERNEAFTTRTFTCHDTLESDWITAISRGEFATKLLFPLCLAIPY